MKRKKKKRGMLLHLIFLHFHHAFCLIKLFLPLDAFDDDEDFLVSDNSSDVAQNNFPVGVAVLCGPNGSGKTSSVYALAKDLGYKVR